MKFRALLATIAIASLLTACNRADKNPVPVVPVEKTTLEVAVDEMGVVESTRIAQIMGPFDARIVSMLDTGTMVKKGDIVAVIDTKDVTDKLQERLEQLRGVKNQLEAAVEDLKIALRSNALDVSSSNAQLDLARVQLEDVNRNLSELEYLKSRNLVAQDEVRTAASNLNSRQVSALSRDMDLRGQVTGSQSAESTKELKLDRIALQGEQAKSRMKEAQDKIDSAEVKAPVDGMFLRFSRWNWQTRKNSERQPGEDIDDDEVLGTIPDLSSLIVRSQIPESDIGAIKQGAEVGLIFEALGNLQIPGKIVTIAPIAIPRETSAGGQITASGQNLTGEKVFEVRVELLRTDPRLKPGLTARTRVVLNRRENVVTIPLEAIQTQNGKHLVQVKIGKSFEQREVEIGESNATRAEVLKGVVPGEFLAAGAVGEKKG